jgi:molybdenum cofactor cytidylyltransferase
VLAAGAAHRFGSLKQLLPWHGGVPLFCHVIDQALACPDVDRVAVTLGAGAEQLLAALGSRQVMPVMVPGWPEGQSQSVRSGLQAFLSDDRALSYGALLFLLADQPGVSPELLTALISRHRETQAPVVAPRHRSQRGNPVLFDRSVWPEFARLAGDVGARPVIQAHQDEIAWVDWPTDDVLRDIDVPEDWAGPHPA